MDPLPDFPNPTVAELRYPSPQGVTTEDRQVRGGLYEFDVTIENTGMAGNVEVTVVLMNSNEQSVWSLGAETAGSYTRYFSEGERRTETFSAEIGAEHVAYGFRLTPAEAEVDVRNDGGDGMVEVTLLKTGGDLGDVALGTETVNISEGATRTVDFSVDIGVTFVDDADGIQIEAEAEPRYES